MSANDTPSSIFDFLPDSLTEGTAAPSPAPQPAPQAEPGRLASMRAQYIVDLSVELHQPLFDRTKQMATRMGVNVQAASHTADMHEVRLFLNFEGSIDDEKVVTVDLVYGGLAWTEGTYVGEQLDMALRIEAAYMLYPAARHVLNDYLTQAGCPTPIPTPNFHDIYDQHVAADGNQVA